MHTDGANFLDASMADVMILFVAGVAALAAGFYGRVGEPVPARPDLALRVTSCGFGFSWDRPFQARLTRWAATSSRLGLRASSHHWPVSATMPDQHLGVQPAQLRVEAARA